VEENAFSMHPVFLGTYGLYYIKIPIMLRNIYKGGYNNMGISELLLRITIGFVVLFVLTRIMGRKEISQMTFVNFVSAISIGSITANLVVNQNLSILNGVIALTGWTVFTLVLAFVEIFSIKGR